MWPIKIKVEDEHLRTQQRTNTRTLWFVDMIIVFGLVAFNNAGPKWAIYLDIIIGSVYVSLRLVAQKIINILEYQEKRYLKDLVRDIDMSDSEKELDRDIRDYNRDYENIGDDK
jgi:fumarate reductase subunit C